MSEEMDDILWCESCQKRTDHRMNYDEEHDRTKYVCVACQLVTYQ